MKTRTFVILAALTPGVAWAQEAPRGPAPKASPLTDAALKRVNKDARTMTRALKAAEGLPPSVQRLPAEIAEKATTQARQLDAEGAAVSVKAGSGRQELHVGTSSNTVAHLTTDRSASVEIAGPQSRSSTRVTNWLGTDKNEVSVDKTFPYPRGSLHRNLSPIPEGTALPDGTSASPGSWAVKSTHYTGWRDGANGRTELIEKNQAYAVDGERGVVRAPKAAAPKAEKAAAPTAAPAKTARTALHPAFWWMAPWLR
jgi:hypothetical protein